MSDVGDNHLVDVVNNKVLVLEARAIGCKEAVKEVKSETICIVHLVGQVCTKFIVNKADVDVGDLGVQAMGRWAGSWNSCQQAW